MDQVTKPTTTMTKEEARDKMFFVVRLDKNPKFLELRKRFVEVLDLSATYISYKLILPLFLPALSRERLEQISLKFSEISDMFYQWYKPLEDAMELTDHLKTEMGIWESYAVDQTLEMGIEKLVQLALADNRFDSAAVIDLDKMAQELEGLNLIPKLTECIAEMKELDPRVWDQLENFSGGTLR